MSNPAQQDDLWEVVDALAGFTLEDPPGYPDFLCPKCGERVTEIREIQYRYDTTDDSMSNTTTNGFGTSDAQFHFYRIPMFSPPMAQMQPCRDVIAIDEAKRLTARYRIEMARWTRFREKQLLREITGGQE